MEGARNQPAILQAVSILLGVSQRQGYPVSLEPMAGDEVIHIDIAIQLLDRGGTAGKGEENELWRQVPLPANLVILIRQGHKFRQIGHRVVKKTYARGHQHRSMAADDLNDRAQLCGAKGKSS